jgi:hypothetical protein
MVRIGRAGLRLFMAVLVVASLNALPPSAAADGYSYLTAQQLAQLRALPIPVVLPTSIPPGFHLVRFEAVRDVVKNGMHSAPSNNYRLVFADAADHKVDIWVADSGFGDAEPDTSSFRRPFTANSSVLGRAKFDPYHLGGSWSWSASFVPVDPRNPKTMMNIQGTDAAALTRLFESMQRLPK